MMDLQDLFLKKLNEASKNYALSNDFHIIEISCKDPEVVPV